MSNVCCHGAAIQFLKKYMDNKHFVLITPDYPPKLGGVARYLSSLVLVSDDNIHVVSDTTSFFQKGWPHWWPLIRLCLFVPPEETLLISHVLPFGTAAMLARLQGGPAYVVIFHGLDLKLAAHSRFKLFLLRQICARAKKVVTNSEATAKLLQQLVPKAQPLVITPGIGAADLTPGIDARKILNVGLDEKVILSVARLVPRKGIDTAIEAISALQQADAHIRYVVIGDGEDAARVKELARTHGASVNFVGACDERTKWLWYSAADIFVLPTREDANDMEGFGIVYLEAALAGLPVVAGRSGGAIEAIDDGTTGFLINPQAIDELRTVLKLLLTDPALRQKMGSAGRQRALRDFTWKARWDKLKAILD